MLGQGSSGIAIADLDGDSQLDVAVTSFEDHVVYVLAGQGDGTFGEPRILPTGAAPLDIAAADMDGDRRLDLVVTNFLDNSISVLLSAAGAR